MSLNNSQASGAVGSSRYSHGKDMKEDNMDVRMAGKIEDDCKVIFPVTWKALTPKNSQDVYFPGIKNKKVKRKSRSNHTDTRIYECDQSHKVWNPTRVKEIFPVHPNQEEFVDDCTEEIQYLNLEDLQVYTKRVPKKTDPIEDLWDTSDFPSVEIATRVHHDVNEREEGNVGSDRKCTSVSHERKLRSLNKFGEKRERYECGASRQSKTCTSTSCQTDYTFFMHCYQDVNVRYLNQALSPDLRNFFFKLISEQNECQNIIFHLLKVICCSKENPSPLSSVPIRTLLSPSEKEYILSHIF